MGVLALTCMLLVQAPAPAESPDSVEPMPWTATATHREEWTRQPTGSLRLSGISVARSVGRGAVIGGVQRADTPDETSHSAGIEVYAPLWTMAEGYMRVAAAPGSTRLPRLLVGGEAVHHVNARWHGSLAAEFRRYELLDAGRVMLGAGWTESDWYVRARAGVIRAGEDFLSGHVIIRRMFGARNHVELVLNAGSDVLEVGSPESGGQTIIGRGGGAALLGRYALNRQLTATAGVGHGALGQFGARTHVEAGLAVHW